MNKNLGTTGLLVTSLVLSVIGYFLPIILEAVLLPIAFLFGMISLMRSIKEKQASKIILSIIAILLPVLVGFWAFYTIKLHDQQIFDQYKSSSPLYNTNSTQQIKDDAATIYQNVPLKFYVNIPPGWYSPSATDNNPHFFSCDPLEVPILNCSDFEISLIDYSTHVGFDEQLSSLKKYGWEPTEMKDFIQGARVIKYSDIEGKKYTYYYEIYYPNKGFKIQANSNLLEQNIFTTFKVY